MAASAALAADTAFSVASFTKIIQSTIAIIILTLVDLVLAKEKASTKAIDSIKYAYLAIDGGLQSVFGERHTKGSKNGAVKGGQVQKRPLIELNSQLQAKARGKKDKIVIETGAKAPASINEKLIDSE